MINSNAPRKTLSAVLFAAAAVAACSGGVTKSEAPGPAAQFTGLMAQQARITEDRTLADRQTIDGVQQRLRKLNEAGIPQNSYSLAKAQCWLDTAKSQYHENDRTGYIEESMTEAVKIAQALEADKSVRAGLDTPLVARSSKLREDLWAQLAAYKNQNGSLCRSAAGSCGSCRRADRLAASHSARANG
ncbi:MAG: hypothetical protein V4772_19555 [Pseudomonadota bacterium]